MFLNFKWNYTVYILVTGYFIHLTVFLKVICIDKEAVITNDQLLIPLLCKHIMNVTEFIQLPIGYKGIFFTSVFVISNNTVVVDTCAFLLVHIASSCKVTLRIAVSQEVCIFSFTRWWWTAFQGICIPTSGGRVPVLPHFLQHLVLSEFLSFASVCKMIVHWDLNFGLWILLNIFYIYLLVFWILSSVKYLFMSFVRFSIASFAFFLLVLVLYVNYMCCKYLFPVSSLAFSVCNIFWWSKVFHFTFPLWVLFAFCLWNSSLNQDLRAVFLFLKNTYFFLIGIKFAFNIVAGLNLSVLWDEEFPFHSSQICIFLSWGSSCVVQLFSC